MVIADARGERERLQHQLGEPDQVRSEIAGIEHAVTELTREHDALRTMLIEREIQQRPAWLTNALGDRPQRARDDHVWDRAGQALAGFRLDHGITDPHAALGVDAPEGSDKRREWDDARATLERAQRQLGRAPSERGHGVDVGLG